MLPFARDPRRCQDRPSHLARDEEPGRVEATRNRALGVRQKRDRRRGGVEGCKRVAERRIEDLSKRTLERITQYLPDDRIAVFKEEIAAQQKAKKAAIELEKAPMRRDEALPEAPTGKAPLRRGAPTKPRLPDNEEKATKPEPPPTAAGI